MTKGYKGIQGLMHEMCYADIYQEWVAANVTETYEKCEQVTLRMRDAFPELERVQGYYCYSGGACYHWWLKTPDGEIVDPTKKQFSSKGFGIYVESTDDMPVPTGKCVHCGELTYGILDPFCGEECARDTELYMRW